MSGVLIGGIIFLVAKGGVVVGYLAMSLGGLASGYIYTSKTCQLLARYKVIKKI